MRRLVAGIVVAAALSIGGVALAADPQPSTGLKGKPAAESTRWGDGKVARGAGDPAAAPATGAPYNLRQIGLGVLIMAAMGGLVVVLIRRTRGPGERPGR
jgi:hypothetical protein